MKDGSPLTVKAALIRSLSRQIPFELFSFLSRAHDGWHDAISGTRVVDVRSRKRRWRNPKNGPVAKLILPAGGVRATQAKREMEIKRETEIPKPPEPNGDG